MRAFLVLAVAMLGACGEGEGLQADRAPDCDIPPMVCADGSDAVPPANPPEGFDLKVCEEGDFDRQWQTYPSGVVWHSGGAGPDTGCWSATSTVAIRRTYTDRTTSAQSTDTCWDRDGEPAECAAVLAEYNKAAMPAE